jgi:hypothetical protein
MLHDRVRVMVRAFPVAGLFLACPLVYGDPAGAETVRDDFAGAEISRQFWYGCKREENQFDVVKAPGQNFRAVKMVVFPRPALATLGLLLRHVACADENGDYRPGNDERAEMWEADAIRLKAGTEVWYQFAMFIDPRVRSEHGRLVIGQWKQSGGHSPFVAQRFSGPAFTITVEQDNRAPGHDPQNTECRIVVAADAAATKPVGSSDPHFSRAQRVFSLRRFPPTIPSLGHDAFDIVHGKPPLDVTLAEAKDCRSDLDVRPLGVLPNPFGRWTTMRYHLRATADESGILEVWADGKPIVKVTGRIGFGRDRDTAHQYFKFGPYRDHAPTEIHALMAQYRRAGRAEDLE